MDSSFLTFSPKITRRKKLSSNVLKTSKSKLFKSKVRALQDICSSPSNLHNIEKNDRESTGSKNKNSDTIVIDDSIVLLYENAKKTKHTSSPSTANGSLSAPKLTSVETITSEKIRSLLCEHVKDKNTQNSEQDKFDEIRNWLNELHCKHERKKQIPVWSTESSSSSVIECSFKSNANTSQTDVVPETVSNESVQRAGKVNSSKIGFNQKIQTGILSKAITVHTGNEQLSRWLNRSSSSSVIECSPKSSKSSSNCERFGHVIPETSSDSSGKEGAEERGKSSADNAVNGKFGERSSVNWKKTESSSDDSWVPKSRKRAGVVIISSESDDDSSDWSYLNASKNNSAELNSSGELLRKWNLPKIKKETKLSSKKTTVDSSSSDKSSTSSGKQISLRKKDKGNNECSRDSLQSDGSVVSKTSAERILSKVYGKSWDKTTVLTPGVQKKKVVRKQMTPEGDSDSIDVLLSQYYGSTWDKKEVLTPLLDRRKVKSKEKENTPPVSGKKTVTKKTNVNKTPKTKLPVRRTSTPIPQGGLRTLKCNESLSFLRSLSASPSPLRCNAKAMLYKKEFKKYKEVLCSELFQLYNAEIFENKLPASLKIEWSIRLHKTAGLCYQRNILRPEGKVRIARIELSTKVCTTADRVRDTLIHELCHAAAWIEDGYKGGHRGPWKTWARKAMRRFPELPVINRCHVYEIETKYIYKCKSCGYSFGRHSKSLDLTRKRCGCCYGEFEVLVNAKTKSATTPRTPRAASGFALFVKENYKATKEKNSDLKHAEIMKLLGTLFADMKVASGKQV